jgi:hypothetical protein
MAGREQRNVAVSTSQGAGHRRRRYGPQRGHGDLGRRSRVGLAMSSGIRIAVSTASGSRVTSDAATKAAQTNTNGRCLWLHEACEASSKGGLPESLFTRVARQRTNKLDRSLTWGFTQLLDLRHQQSPCRLLQAVLGHAASILRSRPWFPRRRLPALSAPRLPHRQQYPLEEPRPSPSPLQGRSGC